MDKDGYHGYYKNEPYKQRTWVGLTDEEIVECFEKADTKQDGYAFRKDYARAIEAKLKEKNSG